MIKTVEIKGEKVKVHQDQISFFFFFFINGDAFIVFGNGLDGQLLISNMMFSSCRYGTQLARRDFAPLLRVITVVPMPSFLRMTLPVRTPSGAFQSG